MKAITPILGLVFFSILFVGCASTSQEEIIKVINIDDIKIVETTVATNINETIATPVDDNKTNAISKPVEAPYVPKDNPRPWSINLYEDSKVAQIDSIEVYLYKEPKENDKKKLIPHFIDQTKTIDILFNAHSTPIITNRPIRVFIDPGHGGVDPGAVAKDKKTYEKTITLDIAQRLKTYLDGAGFVTKLSRTENQTTLSLENRSIMANNWGADIFISIHVNSTTSSKPNGYETYILANVGQLSTSMNKSSMTKSDWDFINATYLGNKNDKNNLLLGYAIHRRTSKTSRIKDRGLRRARYNVLRGVTMPAALVECGYISSPQDLKLLKTADYRERCARGIYQGICDYAYGRMQPGLAATPVPTENKKMIVSTNQPNNLSSEPSKTLQPAQLENTPDRLIKAMEKRPIEKKPIWTPDYKEDALATSPELEAIREQALRAAGISFSTKDIAPPSQKNN